MSLSCDISLFCFVHLNTHIFLKRIFFKSNSFTFTPLFRRAIIPMGPFPYTLLTTYMHPIIYIFDAGLVWRIQLIVIWGSKCLLIEFVMQNLSQIYFCVQVIFKIIFLVQNLCSCVVNSQRLFSRQNAGMKCSY